jgi:hypothetical protein
MRNAAIGLALLVASFATHALAQESGWRVSEVSGDVRTVLNGQTRPVSRGMLLASGSTIASNPGARAVLVSGRDYVILSPSSRVRLPGTALRASGGSWVQNMTQIVSEAGTALYRIEHRPNPHFRVQTPYLAAVVKGTVFSVTVSSSGASVQVTEGAVQVSTVDGGAAELIRPGMVATVEAGDLMELNIQGETSRSIRSSGTPLPGVASVPVADAGRYEGPAETLVEVTAPVREDPVSLSEATDGLVSGQAGADLALADIRGGQHSTAPMPNPPLETAGPPGGPPVSQVDTNLPPGGGDFAQAPPPPGNDAATPAGDGNNGHGNDDGGNDASNPGNSHGGGNDNSGPGNNDGGGNDDAGHGDGNDNSGPGNNNGGGNDDADHGGGNDNSGPGNNNGGGNDDADHGGGNDNSGPGINNGGGNDDADDGNNGHGNDDDGDDDSNPGNGHGGGHGGGNGNGGATICLPADLACIDLGGQPRR